MAPAYLWPMMVIGYSFLIYILSKTDGVKRTALYTFLYFFGYFAVGLYWTSSSLFVEFDRWWWALPFSFAGLPILLTLIPTFLVGLTPFLSKFKTLGIIAALIVSDMVRSFFLTGFPWNMPIHTWTHTPALMELLPVIGFYALNSLTIILFTLPALIIISDVLYKRAVLACVALLFLGIWLYPANVPNKYGSFPTNFVMIQANIPQKEKWDPQFIERNLNRYLNMSRENIEADRPVIVIWPETAISQNLLSYPKLRNQFYDFLESLPDNSQLITGYLYQTEDGFYNATAVLNKDGIIKDIYNKHHLVPFGEYMPFGLDTITGVSNFQAGTIPTTIDLEETKLTILPLICYEIIFSSYAKKTTTDSIIINITNDAWFGKTAGPYQHFDHAVFRARENKIPVFRLSGNGISGIILPNGNVINPTKLNTKAVIRLDN